MGDEQPKQIVQDNAKATIRDIIEESYIIAFDVQDIDDRFGTKELRMTFVESKDGDT